MRILVVYGTANGQTRKIVQFLGEHWQKQSHSVALHDAARLPRGFAPVGFDRIVVASCVRQGEYRRSVARFARRHREALASAIFLSVSMAAANRVNRDDARRWLKGWVASFAEKTGWTPARVEHVAGGLAFTRYDPITKWIMRGIAEDQGYATDTTHDHEYTDWAALAQFADAVVAPSMATAAERLLPERAAV